MKKWNEKHGHLHSRAWNTTVCARQAEKKHRALHTVLPNWKDEPRTTQCSRIDKDSHTTHGTRKECSWETDLTHQETELQLWTSSEWETWLWHLRAELHNTDTSNCGPPSSRTEKCKTEMIGQVKWYSRKTVACQKQSHHMRTQ